MTNFSGAISMFISLTSFKFRVVVTDFQAVCEEKNGVNSRGTSFMFKVLDFLSFR